MDENVRQKMDYYRGVGQNPWNMIPQHPTKEENALTMNKKIMSILADTELATREQNEAMAETKEAVQARDEARKQRDEALAERDRALMERINAMEALQYLESTMTATTTTTLPITNKNKSSKMMKPSRRGSKLGKDLNMQAYSDGVKFKSEWDIQDVGLNLISFDDSTMPVPVCSCTGVSRPCYKWGSGGWQSSCCTTTMSIFPLPHMPNQRRARVGGRKMSGNVFTRLLTRLAKSGHDLSAVPVDLKDYWARHGTNRYIIIK